MRFDHRIVLDAVDLVIASRDRLAIVGDNGAGKSTLLDLLAGAVNPSAGMARVEIPGGIAHAPQEPRFPDGTTVDGAIDLYLADLRMIERAIQQDYERLAVADDRERNSLLASLSRNLDLFEARDGYGVDRRIDASLAQLGLGGLDRGRSMASLSGGEQARVALAAALSSGAELLLLDEPTNDLDVSALAWLEEMIAAHRGALAVVTHDRAFLDRFAVDVIEVENGGIRRYGNGYRGYLAAKASERERMMARHLAWKEELARNEALVTANSSRLAAIPRKLELDGFGHGAFRARSRDHGAMGRIRMAKERVVRLRADPSLPPPEPLRFTGDLQSATDHDGAEPSLILDDVRISHPQLRVDGLKFSIGERWLVTGLSGAGKTTLLRLLAGEREPDEGARAARADLRVSQLRQDVTKARPGTVIDAFARAMVMHRQDAEEALARFGLVHESDFELEVRKLSVGQRRRLDLAVALAKPADLLLLDEPTNHLAPDLVEQLEVALDAHPGVVVSVTHDRYWLKRARQRGAAEIGVHEGAAVVRR